MPVCVCTLVFRLYLSLVVHAKIAILRYQNVTPSPIGFYTMTLFFILMNALMALTYAPQRVVSVELTLQTRGVYKSILVTAKQTEVDINGQHRQQPTPPGQWQTIIKSLQGVNLEELSSLPTDVSRSSVDAALSARVHIKTATQTYESVTYDHPNPPAKLVPLVKALVACAPSTSRAQFR
ncbi:MAG: hypothetical protein JWP57_3199 [Spirosoma sp.]|nr:hypothetical protein [Spirosoma sp.]